MSRPVPAAAAEAVVELRPMVEVEYGDAVRDGSVAAAIGIVVEMDAAALVVLLLLAELVTVTEENDEREVVGRSEGEIDKVDDKSEVEGVETAVAVAAADTDSEDDESAVGFGRVLYASSVGRWPG